MNAGDNAGILKPSELAPLSATKLVESLAEAGLPPGVVLSTPRTTP
jgi:acyl-CoA reductase-like NAD-dependent aldehyde dehydrogenase